MRSFKEYLTEDVTSDEGGDDPEVQTHKPVVFAFGRMNPPTAGHEALVNKVKSVAKAKRAHHEIVLSGSQDAKKNPLSPDKKLEHARTMFPDTNISSATPDQPTLMHHLTRLHRSGHDHLHMVAGGDRIPEYKKLIDKYNGKPDGKGNVPFHFKKTEFHSAGDRDPDSEGVAGISASKMRAFAAKGDFAGYKTGIPKHVSDDDAQRMFSDVQSGMKAKK
jgi:hypothetical protein